MLLVSYHLYSNNVIFYHDIYCGVSRCVTIVSILKRGVVTYCPRISPCHVGIGSIGITNIHFIHVGPLKGTGVSIYLFGVSRLHMDYIHVARIVLAIVDLFHKSCKPMILKLFVKSLEEDETVGFDPSLKNHYFEMSFACCVLGNMFWRLGETFWNSPFHSNFFEITSRSEIGYPHDRRHYESWM